MITMIFWLACIFAMELICSHCGVLIFLYLLSILLLGFALYSYGMPRKIANVFQRLQGRVPVVS